MSDLIERKYALNRDWNFMRLLLLACAGGAIGAGLRHLVNIGAMRLFGVGFPWGTVVVNIAGSLLMGILIEALALRYNGTPEVRTFLATGLLGGLAAGRVLFA